METMTDRYIRLQKENAEMIKGRREKLAQQKRDRFYDNMIAVNMIFMVLTAFACMYTRLVS